MIEQIGQDMWRIKSPNVGPSVVILGGIHGNEKTGAEVVRRLRSQFDAEKISLISGELFLILGNPKAIEENTRWSKEGTDLNRLFCERELSGSGSTHEHVRARELAPILSRINVMIDLHATNKPSVPFLLGKADAAHKKIFQWFSCDRVLTDPNYIFGLEPVTTDEFVDKSGGVGICFETGQAADVGRVETVLKECLDVLIDQKMIEGKMPMPSTIERSIFEMAERIVLTEAGFRFAEGRGLGSFESIRSGETIGFVNDAPIKSTVDGVLIFPKLKEHWKVGQPVVFVAREVKNTNI